VILNIIEMMQKSIYDQYIATNAGITVELLLFALVISTLLLVFIVVIYKFTYRGAVYSSTYSVSLVLTGLVLTVVILPISSNLGLSLATGGSLSMVRFRTAVKDPRDVAFMFWTIGASVTCGAGFYLIAISGTAFIAIVMVAMYLVQSKLITSEPVIAVLRLDPAANVDKVKAAFNKDIEVRSAVYTEHYIEITAELSRIPSNDLLRRLKGMAEVRNMSFVKYNGDFAL